LTGEERIAEGGRTWDEEAFSDRSLDRNGR
jgi:hypothetical protein